MKRSRLSEEQIIKILKEYAAGLSASEVCRKHGLGDATFYKWWSRYGGLGRPQAEGARRRERSAEEAPGGMDAGCIDAEGDARKKTLSEAPQIIEAWRIDYIRASTGPIRLARPSDRSGRPR
jgi:putative transposase